ncbi:MAG: hypothetical protein II938_01980 [Alphaproteobacteria bacterium]|nr:hypothetical protein [Alphaproteobacteria bacterium]
MLKPSVKEILSAPITLARPSTDKEREVFADKQGRCLFTVGSPSGYFYTIGLASGQKFVAHIGSENNQVDAFTLRPLKNLLPNLKEIQWNACNLFPERGITTYCRFVERGTEEEWRTYQEELSPKEKWVKLEGLHKYNPQRVCEAHPILAKLKQILSARNECEMHQQALLAAQKKLKSLEISEENGSSIKTKQIIQTVRKENTNG